jgi:hypothetical protein
MRATVAATLGLALALPVACAKRPAGSADARSAAPTPGAALRSPTLRGLADPTVRGAHLLPASLDEATVWGAAPGGGVRAIVAGMRIVSSAGGDVVAASDRLPANPVAVVELPERMGGGFLMAIGAHLWSAKTWLGIASPLFTMPSAIGEVLVGLDRVYVRSPQGPLVAVDPRTGAVLDLGPLPASPRIASIAALDAWRAVAIADLRGALMTLDAGSSWRPVPLPIEPFRVAPLDEAFSVAGFDRARAPQWWSVLPDGQASWLGSNPPTHAGAALRAGKPAIDAPLGARPLLAAVIDGWPLTDGTALVARDGSLVRVRIDDGAVVETRGDAFSLKPARCHPLSLARAADPGAFGFVCGETRGTTLVLRWDAEQSRLIELRRFDSPREVLSSGNGSLAVRGRCVAPDTGAEQAAVPGDAARRERQDWCLMAPDGDWSEMQFSGADIDSARLVVLSSRRAVLVRPPEGGDLSSARLTLTDGLTDGAHATDLPLRIAPVPPEVARVLRWGIWMDGFEERRPGVLSGWIDAAGSMLGVEITLDGELHPGEYIREAGSPVASGRWAFGWTASRGGFETTDGGMTWTKEIALPEPIAEPRAERHRSCGPMGCVTAGWLRVGWGAAAQPPQAEPPPARPRAARRAPNLAMECVPLGSAPLADEPSLLGGDAGPGRRPSLRATASSWGALPQLKAFAGVAGPLVGEGELGKSIDASHPLERGLRPRPLARAYVWGPSAGEWHALSGATGEGHAPGGHWQVRWLWPWQAVAGGARGARGARGALEERSSAVGPAPWASLELAAHALSSPVGTLPEWTLVPGDDADHALLIERRAGFASTVSAGASSVALQALETDRAPVEIRRVDGEALPELQGAVRSDGRWYVATAQGAGEPSATVLWILDGAVARELGRLSRVAPETAAPGRLVRWVGASGGGPPSALAVVVPGVDADRGSVLWVTSFDAETRTFGDPESLAPADLSDRTVAPCTGDDAGWELDVAYPGAIDLRVGQAWASRLQGVLARLRLSRAAACIAGVFATADSQAAHADGAIAAARATAAGPFGDSARTLDVMVVGEHARARLRCHTATP